MFEGLKQILSSPNAPLGDAVAEVVFEALPVSGKDENSLFQWRVKRRADSGRVFISLKIFRDYWGGQRAYQRLHRLRPPRSTRSKRGLSDAIAEIERRKKRNLRSMKGAPRSSPPSRPHCLVRRSAEVSGTRPANSSSLKKPSCAGRRPRLMPETMRRLARETRGE